MHLMPTSHVYLVPVSHVYLVPVSHVYLVAVSHGYLVPVSHVYILFPSSPGPPGLSTGLTQVPSKGGVAARLDDCPSQVI